MALAWVALALLYLTVLFWIGRWGDNPSPLAKKLTSHPAVYSLALAIYCTAWTFFGAVGEASRNSWNYLPILLGPMLLYLFGFRLIYKLALVSKNQHITTVSDFIASRYGKRQTVALLVTVIALLATVPYIALQLKAIGAAFQLVSQEDSAHGVVLIATLFIAIFSIYFGTKRTDVTEYRRGLILAIAFESTVKLLALLVVAVLGYVWWRQQNSGAILAPFTGAPARDSVLSFSFFAQTLMAAAAVICLPRQFHVAIVDNLSLAHLKTARWLFPLYLALTALVIPIIAAAGQSLLAGQGHEPDTYVLHLAILSDALLVKMLVFVGGLSAATAMIIVATLTLSTMITNDVVLPKYLTHHGRGTQPANYTRTILTTRRIVIALLLVLAYFYHQQMTSGSSLAAIGLIAFSLVIQLLPAIVGGLYWKKGHAHGVYAGLLTGLATWVLWLLLPIFGSDSVDLHTATISQGAILSLLANAAAYVVFSMTAPVRLIDKMQAQSFVAPRETRFSWQHKQGATTTVGDLITLLSTFLGESRCQYLLKEYERHCAMELEHSSRPRDDFLQFCERALGGVIGASSAKALIDSALSGKKLDFEEVVNVFDDTTQAIQFNMSALLTSLESIDQGISVVDKNLKLVAWNKRYLSMFNYPEGLVEAGTPIEKLVRYNVERGECGIGDVDTLVHKRLEHMRNGSPHRFVRQRSDGKMIEMVGNPLPGGGYVTSFTDITAHIEIQQALEEANIDLENRVQKRTEEVQAINQELRTEIGRRAEAEQELIRARQAAEDANASKTRFLALASHDILQPLNAAKLYLSALEEMSLPPSVEEVLHKLDDSVSASEVLIATLLDIARLDQGELQPAMEPYSLADILAPLVDEFSMKAREKGLQFASQLGEQWWVKTDRTFLYRIVQNLLSNAIKYTRGGKIRLTAVKRGERVTLKVADTGIGIPGEEQSKIFADFYRVQGSEQHGVGLGLGVVTRLSKQLGVPVGVASTPGKGSCFSITLPVCAPAPPRTRVAGGHTRGFKGLSVLCIDDQQENLDALQTLLHKWRVNVRLARHRGEVFEALEESTPQILLVDYHLGNDHNGLDLIEEIRRHLDEKVPAALMTANREEGIIESCREHEVSYLSKPLKPAKLRALLQSMQQSTQRESLRVR